MPKLLCMINVAVDACGTASGARNMSEFENTPGPARNTSLWIGIVCVVVVGGGLLLCAGVAGVGLLVPVVFQRQQVQREAIERQAAANAAQQAAAQAHAEAQAATEPDDHPATNENTEPVADGAPTNDKPRVEKDGTNGG
jgi:hypothetical protein